MITYRSNQGNTLFAAYSGDCRIGYVERRQHDRWRWQLSIVMPGGGHGLGVCDDEEHAKDELLKAYQYWMTSAGLQPTPSINKEQTNDTRGTGHPLRGTAAPGTGTGKETARPRDDGSRPRRPAAPAKRIQRSKANS